MTESITKQLATIPEAAYLLGRTEKTVRRYIKLKLLEPVKIGASIYVSRDGLAALIAGSRRDN